MSIDIDLYDAAFGMAWWNSITRLERAWWSGIADSARPCDAWARWKAEMVRTGGKGVRLP